MLSEILLFLAGVVTLPVIGFYFTFLIKPTDRNTLDKQLLNAPELSIPGLVATITSGIFILSAVALKFFKLSKGIKLFISILTLVCVVFLFIGSYYIEHEVNMVVPEMLPALKNTIDNLQQQLDSGKFSGSQASDVSNEINMMRAQLQFYTYGAGLSITSAVLAILSVVILNKSSIPS